MHLKGVNAFHASSRALRRRAIRALRIAVFIIIDALVLAGCFVPEGGHTMRFEFVQEPPGAVVTERKSYFFWGLVPTVHVDVLEKCPYGVIAVVDGSDAGGMRVPTLGLWQRRSTTYYCRPPEPFDTSP